MYVTQSLHRAMQLHPDKTAIRFPGRERTWREFVGRVARLAGALQQLGMKEGDRVAMLSLNSDRYLEYQMAVPWGGGVLTPCNIRWSVPEILYGLDDSGSTILIVDETFSGIAARLMGDAQTLRTVIYCADGTVPEGMLSYEALIEDADPVPDAVRRGEDLLGIFYTGGTTGFPKGVMVSHGSACISALSALGSGLAEPGGVYLHAAPMFHVADFGLALPHWLAGNTHSVIPAFNPEAVLSAIERDGVTHTVLVPTMLQMIVDHPSLREPRNLSSLSTIAYGASPISQTLLERAMAAFPSAGLVQVYGMTEIGPLTINPPGYRPGHFRMPLEKLASAGQASNCVELKIVDPDGNEVPRGTVGEVVARGATLMQGYWNQPEQTAAAIRDGWYHTGDGAWMDEDGYVFIADRMKDMIVSGGENVYSAEVENALARHAAVVVAAVIGIPDTQWGEAVHAIVVIRPGMTASGDELIAHCRSLIAGYKCPRSVEFAEALPVSGAGKVLKMQLRERHWKGQPRKVG